MNDRVCLDQLRQAVEVYHERCRQASNHGTHRDPFTDWFRKLAEPDLRIRVLLVLVDARFDQGTLAERALTNTRAVYDAGILARRNVLLEEIPPLKTRQWVSAHKWRQSFHQALPSLQRLSWAIVNQGEWRAGELLRSILAYRIPYFGAKTARLAVRWLHELVPEIRVDMSDSEVPVDRLVYRVACRLGIINPTRDHYTGPASSADLKIQGCARKLFPHNPSLMDEPLWMMGRQKSKGGYCYPIRPSCDDGCIFASFCPRLWRDVDPASLGYLPGEPSPTDGPGPESSEQPPPDAGAPRRGLLVVVSCVKTKIWDKQPGAPQRVRAEKAYVSNYFIQNASYARRFGDGWCMLSAKYGFVLPHELIENYNFTLKHRDPRLVEPETLRRQIQEKGLDGFELVQVLGGKAYVAAAKGAFAAYGIDVQAPLAGLPIGKAMQAVKTAISKATPLPCKKNPPGR